jgi:ABC-type nitrate/sulfonate/bicarbonate transport system substrate-binding protein
MPATEEVRLTYFSRSVVSALARQRGLYEAAGLSVTEAPVPSSPAQFAALREGRCDLALTSPDNVAAYGLGAANPLGERLDVRILLGVDMGLGLSVLAGPHISALGDLAGGLIGVDVPESGFALALFHVLSAAGLERDRDYTVVPLGSTPQRRLALQAGKCDATLLNAGHDILAELAGFRRLLRITDTLAPYLGTVLAATGPWLDGCGDVAQRFVDAWLAATRLLLAPGEKDAVQLLLGELLELPAGGVRAAYETLVSSRDGLVPDGAVAPAALRTVLDLRVEQAAANGIGGGTSEGTGRGTSEVTGRGTSGGVGAGTDYSAGAVERSGLVDLRLLAGARPAPGRGRSDPATGA